MGPPTSEPIGLQVTRTAKVLSRAFDQVLVAAGGSLPVWLILVSIKSRRLAMQREIADAVGIEGPTLTHHLNALEEAGLVTRQRDRTDRRVQHVGLTEAGDALFFRLLQTVTAFDRSLRSGLDAGDLDALGRVLGRLRANASAAHPAEQEVQTP